MRWLQSSSTRGTYVAAVFYSLLESAHLAGVNPHLYLRAAVNAALDGKPDSEAAKESGCEASWVCVRSMAAQRACCACSSAEAETTRNQVEAGLRRRQVLVEAELADE
jgi:hypothetical protein